MPKFADHHEAYAAGFKAAWRQARIELRLLQVELEAEIEQLRGELAELREAHKAARPFHVVK